MFELPELPELVGLILGYRVHDSGAWAQNSADLLLLRRTGAAPWTLFAIRAHSAKKPSTLFAI